jgi:adenylate kinase family enzyme
MQIKSKMKTIKKIHILGGPGSGKSYASKKLSKLLKIKCFDLDDLVWDNKVKSYGKKAPEKIRDKKLKTILKRRSWIIEGVYFKWLRSSFSYADCIIILTPNVFIRDFRIIKRFIKRKTRLINIKHESMKDVFNLLKWNHQYAADDLIKLKEFIKTFDKKIKYFKKADQAIKYIQNQVKITE